MTQQGRSSAVSKAAPPQPNHLLIEQQAAGLRGQLHQLAAGRDGSEGACTQVALALGDWNGPCVMVMEYLQS